jgi:hypothetical protein
MDPAEHDRRRAIGEHGCWTRFNVHLFVAGSHTSTWLPTA